MANIEELKITSEKTNGKHVADLPTNPSESLIDAQTLQEQFDALPELVIEALNTLIDYLVANGAGEKITAQSIGARPNTWMPSAADVGALPLNGSIPMIGDLIIDKGTRSMIIQFNNITTIRNRIDGNNYQDIQIGADGLKASKTVNGAWGGDIPIILADGSVPMIDKLNIVSSASSSAWATILHNTAASYFRHYKNGNAYRDIVLSNSYAPMYTVKNENEDTKQYYLFGEHNKELLSGEMLALPSIANGYDTGDSVYWVDADGTGHIILRIAISGGKNIGETAVAKLPVGARPNRRCDIAVLCQKASSVEVALGYITSSGDVFIWNPSGQTIYYVYGEFVYKVAN